MLSVSNKPFILSVKFSGSMLSFAKLSVIMLIAIMLSVVAPFLPVLVLFKKPDTIIYYLIIFADVLLV